ncbi:hypothetical protein [Arthrobacter sp. ISL-69]|uniref:hypothetical protein n=1 Tax=Arthrobacter sp. ISL-69 TaxID=2819113 RepID=UPI001BE5FF1E|nr:hypothetical protein [Arthrobacter sp. ISL-69]MBT2538473.1 hypothetical protein [Arthrobacter sp. ISL-69]
MKANQPVMAARVALGLTGAGLACFGLLGLPTQLGPAQLVGLLTWMAMAVLVHDGLIVPVSTAAGAGLRRLGSGLRPASMAVLRSALMIGVVVTLVAGTLLKAQSVARSTTVLEASYATNLAWFWAVLAAVAGATIVALERKAPRRAHGTQDHNEGIRSRPGI